MPIPRKIFHFQFRNRSGIDRFQFPKELTPRCRRGGGGGLFGEGEMGQAARGEGRWGPGIETLLILVSLILICRHIKNESDLNFS